MTTYSRPYYLAHRETILASQKAARLRNPEVSVIKSREAARLYRERKGKEAINASSRAWTASRRKPMVYVIRNKSGVVIYVGRGTLNRVVAQARAWRKEMASLRSRVCKTWGDSLVLEAMLIRKYQPKHNAYGVTK